LYSQVTLRIERTFRLQRRAPDAEIFEDGSESRMTWKQKQWEIKAPEAEQSNWRMVGRDWKPTHMGGRPDMFAEVASIEDVADHYAIFRVPLKKEGTDFPGPIPPTKKPPKWVVHSWVDFALRPAFIDTLVSRDVRVVEPLIASQRTP
jgi:hypothetical protein